MNTPFRFIIIDSDEANSFVSCKAIMLAARETTIQSFNDPEKGMEYIKARKEDLIKNKILLFLNAEIHGMKALQFLEQFDLLTEKERKRMSVYLIGSHPEINNNDLIDKFPFVKGSVQKPLSRQNVSEFMISL